MDLQLIPDASDYGFIEPVAKSRRRLVIATVISLGLTYGFAFWTTHFIFNTSASVVLNMFVITANMIVLIASSYVTTVMAGDLFFPSGWRREVILKPETDDERFALNDYNTEFFFLLLGILIANAVGVNFATGNAFSRYNTYGFFQVRLRASEAALRTKTLEQLGEPLKPKLNAHPPLKKAVLETIDDPVPEVRHRAMWLVAKRKVTEARKPLEATLESARKPMDDRRRAAIALGRLELETERSLSIAPYLIDRLDSTSDVGLKRGLIRGLGVMKASDILDPAPSLLESDNPGLVVDTLWAIRRTRLPEARQMVRDLLDTTESSRLRCAAYDAMKWVAGKEDLIWARKQFQSFDKNKDCSEETWKEGPKDKHTLIYGDSFRVKCLKIVANTDPYSHDAWINRLARDPQETDDVRRVARDVLRQMSRK